jgi:hypothetical protein
LLLCSAPAAAVPSTSPSWTFDGSQDTEQLGASAAVVGDLNGDGFDDVAGGAPTWDGAEQDMGRVHVFFGSERGLSATPTWTAQGAVEDAQFGVSVAGVGDVNNDGFDDLLIGAEGHDAGSGAVGAVFLYFGSASGLRAEPDWTATGENTRDAFGHAVSAAGDVNGDGYDDLLVGAFRWSDVQVRQGKAYLFRGGPAGPGAAPDWSTTGVDPAENLGASVARGGDVNNDGFDDVLIAAPGYANGDSNEGRVLLFAGSAAGLGAEPAWEGESDYEGASFGQSLDGVGDVDGDGFDDVVIGMGPEQILAWPGPRVRLYRGSASGLSVTESWSALTTDYPHSHIAVRGAGDVDGDGLDDVIVGRETLWLDQHGDAWLFLGDETLGLEAEAAWHWTPTKASQLFGSSVDGGDIDGDGLSDLLIGSRGFNGANLNAGRLAFYPGGESEAGDDDDATDDDDFNPEIFGDGGGDLDAGGPCNSSLAASGSAGALLLLGLVAIARRRVRPRAPIGPARAARVRVRGFAGRFEELVEP